MMRPLVPAACLLALAGCNEDPGADNGKGDHRPTTVVPLPLAYPKGPYGFTQGSVIPGTVQLDGFVDAQQSTTTLQTITLADFYNPHGRDPSYEPAGADDRLYPAGSQYGPEGTTKKPRALYIDVSAGWCGPCKTEASKVLPGLYAKYHPCGGEFLLVLGDGDTPGAPLDDDLLRGWTKNFMTAYPSAYDQGHNLQELYPSNAFPDGAIIDTATMTISKIVNGLPDDSFWSTYESLLDASCLARQ